MNAPAHRLPPAVPDAAAPVPAVNMAEILRRLDAALMALLVSGAEQQTQHLLVVERLCVAGRSGMAHSPTAVTLLAAIEGKAPIIAGLTLAHEGLRERAYAECVRHVADLSTTCTLDRLNRTTAP